MGSELHFSRVSSCCLPARWDPLPTDCFSLAPCLGHTSAFPSFLLSAGPAGIRATRGSSAGWKALKKPKKSHSHSTNTVAVYERLVVLTEQTYLFGNDLMATHWQTILPSSIKKDLKAQTAWLEEFLSQPAEVH